MINMRPGLDTKHFEPVRDCCGDAHQELQWTLDWVTQLGFEKQNNGKEVIWRNVRAETAEKQLAEQTDLTVAKAQLAVEALSSLAEAQQRIVELRQQLLRAEGLLHAERCDKYFGHNSGKAGEQLRHMTKPIPRSNHGPDCDYDD